MRKWPFVKWLAMVAVVWALARVLLLVCAPLASLILSCAVDVCFVLIK
jgi:hypothetical protein